MREREPGASGYILFRRARPTPRRASQLSAESEDRAARQSNALTPQPRSAWSWTGTTDEAVLGLTAESEWDVSSLPGSTSTSQKQQETDFHSPQGLQTGVQRLSGAAVELQQYLERSGKIRELKHKLQESHSALVSTSEHLLQELGQRTLGLSPHSSARSPCTP